MLKWVLVLVVGVVFIVAGLAFKLGAVPFHMWLPDVYHGAPTAITLLIAGAPKLAAVDHLRRLETAPRGVYCGAVGWVDADAGTAEIAVAIRTFWREDGPAGPMLAFGTGAGITWSSDPAAEWRETELKADRLLRIASEGEMP